MSKIKIPLLILVIISNVFFNMGCWNYREVDKLTIVAGLAIDKGETNNYEMTAEIIKVGSGKDVKMTSQIVSSEGATLFDAARNIIAVSGKRLYWAHTKVLILSKDIAREGVSKVLEWYNRDAETREDVQLLISQEETAKVIFDEQEATEDIISIALDETLFNETSLSKIPKTDIITFDIESQTKGASQVIPAINIKKMGKKKTPQILGCAIIKKDKLVGFLDGDQTKELLFIRDEIKGGLLVQQLHFEGRTTKVSLEVLNNKTKVTPLVEGNKLTLKIEINTEVAIDEINGPGGFFYEKGLQQLKQQTEKTLTKRVQTFIYNIQHNYDADIFQFSAKLWQDKAKVFQSVSSRWDEVFRNLEIIVQTNIDIKNSAILSKSIGEGDS